jgi:hypothetical protein
MKGGKWASDERQQLLKEFGIFKDKGSISKYY